MNVIAWIIAIAAWVVILGSGPALIALLVVPRCRRWWLGPLRRRRAARRASAYAARQVVIGARTAQLEAELEVAGLAIPAARTVATGPPGQMRQMRLIGGICATCGRPVPGGGHTDQCTGLLPGTEYKMT